MRGHHFAVGGTAELIEVAPMAVKLLGVHSRGDLGLSLKRADDQPHFCRKHCASGEILLRELRQKGTDP